MGVKSGPQFKMNIFIIFSCFFSLLMGSNMALTCWDSDGYQTVSEYNMNVVYPVECPSSANTSCFQKFYRVVTWGHYYAISGCSDQQPRLTTVEKRGSRGDYYEYFCN